MDLLNLQHIQYNAFVLSLGEHWNKVNITVSNWEKEGEEIEVTKNKVEELTQIK